MALSGLWRFGMRYERERLVLSEHLEIKYWELDLTSFLYLASSFLEPPVLDMNILIARPGSQYLVNTSWPLTGDRAPEDWEGYTRLLQTRDHWHEAGQTDLNLSFLTSTTGLDHLDRTQEGRNTMMTDRIVNITTPPLTAIRTITITGQYSH